MAAPTGVQSYIQMHSESTYGTLDTSVKYKKQTGHINFAPAVDAGFHSSQAITATGAVARQFPNPQTIRGTWSGEAGFENIDQMLYWMMGVATQSVPTGAGGVAFDHWYRVNATPPSMSIQTSYADIPTDKVWSFVGCYAESLDINFTTPGIVQFSTGFVPWKENGTAGGDDPKTTDQSFLHIPMSTNQMDVRGTPAPPNNFSFTLGDLDETVCVTAFRMTMNRPIEAGTGCAGSTTPKEPGIGGVLSVTGEVEVVYQSEGRDLFESLIAGTLLTDGYIGFVGDAITGTGTPTLYYTTGIYMPQFYIVGPGVPEIAGPGILKQRFGFAPFGDTYTSNDPDGTPDEVSDWQPVAILTRNTNDNSSSAW